MFKKKCPDLIHSQFVLTTIKEHICSLKRLFEEDSDSLEEEERNIDLPRENKPSMQRFILTAEMVDILVKCLARLQMIYEIRGEDFVSYLANKCGETRGFDY